MPKFYIRLQDPFIGVVFRHFVVQADTELAAIAKLWQHEFWVAEHCTEAQLQSLILGHIFNIEASYWIHQGRASEAVEVRSAPALMRLSDDHKSVLLQAIRMLYGSETVAAFVAEAVG